MQPLEFKFWEWFNTGMNVASTKPSAGRLPTAVRSGLSRAILFGIVWWFLVDGDLSSWPLAIVFISAAVGMSTALAGSDGASWRLSGILRFLPYFLKESLVGGLDVARRAFDPVLPLKPGLIEYRTRLPERHQRALLACIISLLPGTLSAEVADDMIVVHVLDLTLPHERSLGALESRLASMFIIDPGGAAI